MQIFHRRIAWPLGGLIAALAVIAAVGYWHFYVNIVKIDNQSSADLTNVRMIMAGSPVWTGIVASHHSRTVYGVPEAEGELFVSFDIASHSMRENLGYITPGIADVYVMTVSPDLKVRFVMKTK